MTLRHFLHLREAGHEDPLHTVEAIPGEPVALPVTPGATGVTVQLESVDVPDEETPAPAPEPEPAVPELNEVTL